MLSEAANDSRADGSLTIWMENTKHVLKPFWGAEFEDTKWLNNDSIAGLKTVVPDIGSMSYTASLSGKVKVKLALEQNMKVQRWSRGIALLFL